VTEDLIRQYIDDELAKDVLREPLRDDDLLLERQILDSLGLFQLVGYLENEFDIEVRDEELVPANFGSVRDIARLVREKQS
jgi:acyl carrier protein